MANNKDFIVKNGFKPTAYYEGVGTVTSAAGSYVIANATYAEKSKDVSADNDNPQGIWIREDNGTDFYMLGTGTGGDRIDQYLLSTAFDISTAAVVSAKTLDVSPQTSTDPTDMYFRSDGLKLYVCDQTGVYQYALSSAWDLSTASFETGKSVSISSQETANQAVAFSADGDRMFIVGSNQDTVFQYNLSTDWDVSTATYSNNSLDISGETSTPSSIRFSDDGKKVFIAERTASAESILQYSMTTAYDVSTMSYDSVSLDVSAQEGNPMGLAFGDNGTKIYVVGSTSDTVFQYTSGTSATLDLSTGGVFDYTPTSDLTISITNPAASGTVSQATMLLTGGAANTYDVANATYDSKSFDFSDYEATFLYDGFFKPDGTKFFIIGTGTDKVQAFNLSTAWDISTVSAASEEFSPTQAGAEPISLSFKSDGTKMYVSSYGGLTVYQYSLSTAWDVSSATYESKSFSYGTQANAAYHIELSSDGTKLYVNNTGNASPGFIYQYTLSTAWDISTASYDSVALDLDASPAPSLAANCYTFTFSDDGTKLFNMAENAGDAQVITYNLTSAWNISTATYADEDYDIAVGNQNNPVVFRVGDGGTKMYYGGTGDQTIYQFTTVSAGTITYDTTIEWPGGTAPTSPSYGETDVLTFTTTDGGATYQGSQAIDGAQ